MEIKHRTIAFSILHYQSFETTKHLIENILDIIKENDNIEIVVTDNGSPNGTGKTLKDQYGSREHVHIILSEKNLGFAKGNNLGYEYCRNVLKAETILVMNNDLIIEQYDFVRRLEGVLEKNPVDILAPDIINLDNIHQNPLRNHGVRNIEILKEFIYNFITVLIMGVPVINTKMDNLLSHKKSTMPQENDGYKTIQTDIVPQGSCIIFANNYVKQMEYAFYPKTFLYAEEDCLYYLAKRQNLSIQYNPHLSVRHLEGVSTKIGKNNITVRKNRAKHKMKSLFILFCVKNHLCK